MAENKKATELRDEDLKKINGGGSGTIPSSGIQFMTYYIVSDGYYYSSAQNTSDVVYVYRSVNGDLYYSNETFVCEGDKWTSNSAGYGREIEDKAKFRSSYPYQLNIW